MSELVLSDILNERQFSIFSKISFFEFAISAFLNERHFKICSNLIPPFQIWLPTR